jgi:hypothetical protein
MDSSQRAPKPDDWPDHLVSRESNPIARPPEEPPVVARLMVEIRSDGSYTIARGALEDSVSGQKVAVEATGSTPLALALSLAKSLAGTPWLARQAFRALLKR